MPAPEGCCPDCWCHIEDANHSMPNSSAYCDACLLERVLKDGRVDAGTWTDEVTGKVEHLFYTVCQNCNGTGQYLVSAWQKDTYCYGCLGLGARMSDREGVQRTGRWWATFQGNREPGKTKRPGPPEHTHPRRR